MTKTYSITVSCPVFRSFRVEQIAGMFDLPLTERSQETFRMELPELNEEWRIGAIVGPSGSGKTTLAAHAFGEALYQPGNWAEDCAVIDGFGSASAKEITHVLTAVGFSSPPAWVRPYQVLSGGEKFRCDLARALLSPRPLVVFDEFTSVVDRTAARFGSAAAAKSIRSGRVNKRLVVVTCHYDVLDWLAPDWIADMAAGRLARGSLRRPEIVLTVARCRREMWRLFARHHYLSGSVPGAAQCYVALWNEQPVAFCAVAGLFGFKGRKRICRVVTLPDYQGLGIGVRLMERVAWHEQRAGFRIHITASHPAMIGYMKRSPNWRGVGVKRLGNFKVQTSQWGKRVKSSGGRSVASFEYAGGREER